MLTPEENFSKNLISALENSDKLEPSADLLDKIIIKIEARKRILAIKSIVSYASLVLLSIIALGFSLSLVQMELAKTGADKLLSLALTDWQMLLSYWQDYSIYLLEIIPVYAIIFALSSILLLLILVKQLESILRSSFKIFIHPNHKTI